MRVIADTRSWGRFADALRRGARTPRRAYRVATSHVADEVVTSARARAAFSHRIPGTVHKVIRSDRLIEVRAGGAAAPDAAVLEHRGSPGDFSHPVFGSDVRVRQAARPFLTPATATHKEAAYVQQGEAVADAIRAALKE